MVAEALLDVSRIPADVHSFVARPKIVRDTISLKRNLNVPPESVEFFQYTANRLNAAGLGPIFVDVGRSKTELTNGNIFRPSGDVPLTVEMTTENEAVWLGALNAAPATSVLEPHSWSFDVRRVKPDINDVDRKIEDFIKRGAPPAPGPTNIEIAYIKNGYPADAE